MKAAANPSLRQEALYNEHKLKLYGALAIAPIPQHSHLSAMPKTHKHKFLREQYRRMLASDHHIDPRWRDSFDAFLTDIDHLAPNTGSRRIIGRRNLKLGFVPGNVEWHWESTTLPASRENRGR
jgi:hypothetical protein